jgi:hypothetical protein
MEQSLAEFKLTSSDMVFGSIAFEDISFKHHLVFGLGPSWCV